MVSANAEDNPEAPLFSVVLRPHRSLSPCGFLAVMAVLAAMSFTAGTIFWAIGAWPVIGFLGLDVALVYVAFRLNFRAAQAAEIIRLVPDKLTIRRVDALGRASEVVVNPYWARLEVDRHPEFGVLRMAIASRGTRLPVGRFIPPPEREKFARAFGAALAAARTVPAP